MKEDRDPKWGGRVVGGLAWLIQDDAIRLFERGGVVPELQQRSEEVGQEVGSSKVYSFLHWIGDRVRSQR